MRILALAVLLCALACTSIVSLPYRAQLQGPSRMRPPRMGSVIAERSDGSLLFKFDDATEGDSGYLWVSPDDTRYRIVRGVASTDIQRRGPPRPFGGSR